MPADLVLVHVDLSVVPEPYLEFAARYPIVLNGRVRDIRKTATSRHLVRPGDDRGPGIVKADLDCGGYPEYLSSLTGLRRLRTARAVASRVGVLPTWRDYRVFERLADVPASLLENRDPPRRDKDDRHAAYLDSGTLAAERRRQADGIHSYFGGLKPL